MEINELHKIYLGVVLNNKGEVLIVKRAKVEKGTNEVVLSWVFPGGGPLSGEEFKETLKREMLEETGYLITYGHMISERKHPEFPVYIYYANCVLTNNEQVQEPCDKEVAVLKWVRPSDLKKYFTSNFDSKVAKFLGV